MSLLENNKYTKKISYITISQVVSLLVSALLILILPKFVSVKDYGYWQLFVLYSGYVGLFHFGYSDGLYIKIGGKTLESLNKKPLSEQFNLFLVIQFFISIIIVFFALKYSGDENKKFVFIAIAFFLVIENVHKLLSFLLLATDNSIVFSKSILIDKLVIVVYLISLVFTKDSSFTTIIIVYVITRALSLLYLIWYLRSFVRLGINLSELGNTFKNVLDKCRLGIILTLSNILGTLILATGRLFIEHFWSIELFAQVSLAISLSMFVLAVISQISLVLYPTLRNMRYEKQKEFLHNSSILLGYFGMLCFVFYFIAYFFIRYWLIDYTESLNYLAYLFPIVLFEAKTQVLYITYCKTLSKLKILLIVNFLTLLFAVSLYFVASLLNSINFVLITMFLALMFRSVFLNVYLFRIFKLRLDKSFIIEIFFAILFVMINVLGGFIELVVFYIVAFFCLQLFYKKDVSKIILGFRQ